MSNIIPYHTKALIPDIKIPYLRDIYQNLSYDWDTYTLTIYGNSEAADIAITYVVFLYAADLISLEDAARMLPGMILQAEASEEGFTGIYRETYRLWNLLRGNDL